MISSIIGTIKQSLKWQYILILSALCLVCGPVLIGCTVYYIQETSHYVPAECHISNCTVDGIGTCTRMYFRRISQYTCYSGQFDYTLIRPEANYTKQYQFRRWATKCHNATTSHCTYDDRDIEQSLILEDQSELFGFLLGALLSGTALGVGIIYSTIMFIVNVYYKK